MNFCFFSWCTKSIETFANPFFIIILLSTVPSVHSLCSKPSHLAKIQLKTASWHSFKEVDSKAESVCVAIFWSSDDQDGEDGQWRNWLCCRSVWNVSSPLIHLKVVAILKVKVVLRWPHVLFYMREEVTCSHFTSRGCEYVTVKRLILGGVSLENAHILPASTSTTPSAKGGSD